MEQTHVYCECSGCKTTRNTRNRFEAAVAAMQGMMSNSGSWTEYTAQEIAVDAVHYADALIAELGEK